MAEAFISRGPAEGADHAASVPPARAPIERRNYVIERLVENGYITAEAGEKAKKEPLTIAQRGTVFHTSLLRAISPRTYAAKSDRQIRREAALRGWPVNSHHARSQDADDRSQGAHRRPHSLRRGPGLSRDSAEDRYQRRLGRQARGRARFYGCGAVAARRGAGNQRSVGANWAAAGTRAGRRRGARPRDRQHPGRGRQMGAGVEREESVEG